MRAGFTSDGIVYHFDGTLWSEVLVIAGPCSRIQDLWGIGGTVFVETHNRVVRLEDGNVTIVLELPCEEYRTEAIYGNSADELFVLVSEEQPSSCGNVHVLWWNGEAWGAA